MKTRLIKLAALIFAATVILPILAGCTWFVPKRTIKPGYKDVYTYSNKNFVPKQLIVDNRLYDHRESYSYAILASDYTNQSNPKNKVAVGKAGEQGRERIIYHAPDGASIPWIAADVGIRYIAWFDTYEKESGEVSTNELRLYDRLTGKLSLIASYDYDGGEVFELYNVFIIDGGVYYHYADASERTAKILRYSIEDEEVTEVISLGFFDAEDYTWQRIASFSANDSYLIYSEFKTAAQPAKIHVFNTQDGTERLNLTLSSEVGDIYGADFDSEYGTYAVAVYYKNSTTGKEEIGYIKSPDGSSVNSPKAIYTLGSKDIVLNERLMLRGNYLIYSTYTAVSGIVSEHHRTHLYELDTDIPMEAPTCFWAAPFDGGHKFMGMCYDKNGGYFGPIHWREY